MLVTEILSRFHGPLVDRAKRGYWQQYLNPCCPNCRVGTGDCDINPLAEPPTQADCALWLMRMGECP